MDMFDTVIIADDIHIPNYKDGSRSFQTKDFNSMFDTYYFYGNQFMKMVKNPYTGNRRKSFLKFSGYIVISDGYQRFVVKLDRGVVQYINELKK